MYVQCSVSMGIVSIQYGQVGPPTYPYIWSMYLQCSMVMGIVLIQYGQVGPPPYSCIWSMYLHCSMSMSSEERRVGQECRSRCSWNQCM